VYLALVNDAFSRRVIGWALDRTLEDDLTLAALLLALDRRRPASATTPFGFLDLVRCRGSPRQQGRVSE
jgi:transposase InsO family protein